MELHPHHSPDDEPRGPDAEQLSPGEIDLTGVVEQEDALRDVISDAIVEAEAAGTEVPAWGARTLARALANRVGTPVSALHQFAVTGEANREAMARELATLYANTADDETQEWINWLGTYVIRLGDEQPSAGRSDTEAATPNPAEEAQLDSTPLEKVSTHLRLAFTEADARGEAISREDAQAIATLLGPLLPADSQTARFAETGDAHPTLIHEECQRLKNRSWRTSEISTWVQRFEQYLASRADMGANAGADPDAVPDTPEIQQGIRERGDAFRAFLQLPNTDPSSIHLLEQFYRLYVGSFSSLDAVVDTVTNFEAAEAAIEAAAARWGLPGCVRIDRGRVMELVRATWDIVDIRGTFYAFTK